MPRRLAPRIHNPIKKFRHNPRRHAILRFRVLLRRRQVEDQICLDQGSPVRLMQEYKLLVPVARNVLILELGIEGIVDTHVAPIGSCEDGVKFWWRDAVNGLGVLGHAGALLGEAIDADDLGLGEGARPFGEEDVVLEVGSDNVGDRGGADSFSNAGGQGDRGEDGTGIVLEADWGMALARVGEIRGREDGVTECASAANLEESKAEVGGGEGGDVGSELADGRYRCWI